MWRSDGGKPLQPVVPDGRGVRCVDVDTVFTLPLPLVVSYLVYRFLCSGLNKLYLFGVVFSQVELSGGLDIPGLSVHLL